MLIEANLNRWSAPNSKEQVVTERLNNHLKMPPHLGLKPQQSPTRPVESRRFPPRTLPSSGAASRFSQRIRSIWGLGRGPIVWRRVKESGRRSYTFHGRSFHYNFHYVKVSISVVDGNFHFEDESLVDNMSLFKKSKCFNETLQSKRFHVYICLY